MKRFTLIFSKQKMRKEERGAERKREKTEGRKRERGGGGKTERDDSER